jgi:hypothetical protein
MRSGKGAGLRELLVIKPSDSSALTGPCRHLPYTLFAYIFMHYA